MLLAQMEVQPQFTLNITQFILDLGSAVACALGPWLGLLAGIWIIGFIFLTVFVRLFNYGRYRRQALSINPNAELERFNVLSGQWDRPRGVLESGGIDEQFLKDQLKSGQIDALSYFQLLRAVRTEKFYKDRWEFERQMFREGKKVEHHWKLNQDRLLYSFEKREEQLAKIAALSAPAPMAGLEQEIRHNQDLRELEEEAEADLDEVDEAEGFSSSSFPQNQRKKPDSRAYDSAGNYWDDWDFYEDPFN